MVRYFISFFKVHLFPHSSKQPHGWSQAFKDNSLHGLQTKLMGILHSHNQLGARKVRLCNFPLNGQIIGLKLIAFCHIYTTSYSSKVTGNYCIKFEVCCPMGNVCSLRGVKVFQKYFKNIIPWVKQLLRTWWGTLTFSTIKINYKTPQRLCLRICLSACDNERTIFCKLNFISLWHGAKGMLGSR